MATVTLEQIGVSEKEKIRLANYEWFLAHLDKLRKEYLGKLIAVHRGKVVAAAESTPEGVSSLITMLGEISPSLVLEAHIDFVWPEKDSHACPNGQSRPREEEEACIL